MKYKKIEKETDSWEDNGLVSRDRARILSQLAARGQASTSTTWPSLYLIYINNL